MGKKATPQKNNSAEKSVLELSATDIDLLDKLNTRLNLTIDTSSHKSLISGLIEALFRVVSDGENAWQTVESSQQKKSKNQERNNTDRIDALAQRNLKGNFIIHSPENQGKGLTSLLKRESDLGEESYVDHVRGLVESHYGVDIPRSDIAACHPLSNGAAILKIWNRKNCAPYHKLVAAVKVGGKFGLQQKQRARDKKQGGEGEKEEKGTEEVKRPNLFLTFQLTRRRSELVKHLKTLKKSRKISSFTTDQNGLITFKKTFDSEKIFVTVKCDEEDSDKRTLWISEIDSMVN